MKKRNILLALMLLLPILWTGCTHEDYRNCPAGLYITFAPINPKNVYPDVVQHVSLYFYNPQTGELAEEFQYTREELRETDRAAFVPQIPTGTYRVVSIINCGIFTQTTDVESYSTLRTMLNEHLMDYEPIAFFSGEKEITVGVNATAAIPEETVAITKHNSNVHVNLVYDGYDAQPGIKFASWIEGNNCCYEYADNRHSTMVRYVPWDAQVNEEGLSSRFSSTTMLISTDSDMMLHLEETSGTRAEARHYSFVLADLLGKLIDETNPDDEYLYDTDEELAFEDEFELTIKIGKDNVLISVGVDRWDTIAGQIEL